jgi:hypothetical protein
VLAAFADRSVPNLSSIVVVAEFAGLRMLLTGDARGDDILEGLATAGLLDADGAAHFDLIKMPHHGSNRNVTRDWLKMITADHYVISANGEHGNPDAETLRWICEARAGAAYTVYLTNRDMIDPKTGADIGRQMDEVFESHPDTKRNVQFRRQNAVSVKAEIGDAIDY